MLEQLCMLRDFETRSVCSENKTGEKGMGGRTSAKDGVAARAARDLGDGWKTNPYERIAPGETREIMNVAGEGMIRHIWMTPAGSWRNAILRFYWDGSETPSGECPIGDFFACGWGSYAPIRSLAVCVNPGSAFNCYWSMPFRKGCRVTVENRADEEFVLYYQITYEVRPIPAECAYFHAQFRRVNPLPYKQVYTILDSVKGKGHYVGTYMAWGVNNNGWWGEGEIKFYLDGDDAYPTICGTGTEDYFCGSYNFEDPVRHDRYETFTSPYSGTGAGDRPQRALSKPDALWPVSLAHQRPDLFPIRLARDHSGVGLAQRRTLFAPAGRHRFRSLLVPDSALPTVPPRSAAGMIGNYLTKMGLLPRQQPPRHFANAFTA